MASTEKHKSKQAPVVTKLLDIFGIIVRRIQDFHY